MSLILPPRVVMTRVGELVIGLLHPVVTMRALAIAEFIFGAEEVCVAAAEEGFGGEADFLRRGLW